MRRAQGRDREAAEFAHQTLAGSERLGPLELESLGRLLKAKGPISYSMRLRDLLTAKREHTYVSPSTMASACLCAGDRDDALRSLGTIVEERESGSRNYSRPQQLSVVRISPSSSPSSEIRSVMLIPACRPVSGGC